MSYDITANYHGGNPESMTANERARYTKRRDRSRIIGFLHTRGAHGATCYEAEQALGMAHQTCSARFSDLKKDNVIVATALTRPTDTGSPARVCVLQI